MTKERSLITVIKLTFILMCLFTIFICIVELADIKLGMASVKSSSVAILRNLGIRNAGHIYLEHNDITLKPTPLQEILNPISSNVVVNVPARSNGIHLTDSYIHSVGGKQFRVIKKLARNRNHTNVGNNTYFIFSAIANIKSNSPSSFLIVLSGWELGKALDMPYRCCMLHRNGTITSVVTRSKRRIDFGNKTQYQARQIVCPYRGSGNPMENPMAVGLVLAKGKCSSGVIYEEPTYNTYDASPRFAVIGKIAYGSKNPNQLIEWVEFNRHFGASKLVIYPYYDLNDDARKVLDYYVKEGIMDVVPMAPVPLLEEIPRYFGIHQKVMFQDEQVADNDGQERLAPYVYFTLIDTDEFLLPNRSFKSYVELMEGLLKKHPAGACFTMKVQVHPFDWGRTNADHPLMLSRYSNHTETMLNTEKLLHVSARVRPGTAWIHSGLPKKGYKNPVLNDNYVIMKHYRKCRAKWMQTESNSTKSKCFDIFMRSRDLYIEEVADKIQQRVLDTRKVLGMEY